MAPRKKKKMKKSEETLTLESKENKDRISDLPDNLLVHILSLLDSTEDAIKTGALSKRWRSVWTSIPNLIFDQCKDCHRTTSDFVSSVNKTLDQCRYAVHKLKTFKVKVIHHQGFKSDVKRWLNFALRRNVEELELMMLSNITFKSLVRGNHLFKLPQGIFINSKSVSRLGLDSCILKPEGKISWPMLTNLFISNVLLDEVLIENILSGSPALESLVLDTCNGYDRLNISSKSLKVLKIIGLNYYRDSKNSKVKEINAPDILSLVIGGNLYDYKILLQNVSSLVDASLDYRMYGTEEVSEERMLKGLIESLRHVKELRVGISCSEVFSRLEAKGFHFPSTMKLPVDTEELHFDNDTLEASADEDYVSFLQFYEGGDLSDTD